MDYNKINDYEYIYMIKENDEDAYSSLYKKYIPMINKLSKDLYFKYKFLNIDYDDLCQEGLYGLCLAIQDFKESDGTSFSSLAYIYIKRSIQKMIINANRLKKMNYYNTLSLEEEIFSTGLLLNDVIYNSCDLIDNIMELNEKENIIKNKIYSLEFDSSSIFELKYNGFSNMEISKLLGFNYKKIDNTIRIIKKSIIDFTN